MAEVFPTWSRRASPQLNEMQTPFFNAGAVGGEPNVLLELARVVMKP